VAADGSADLELSGVRTHNLKDVDVAFPRGGWTSVCGVSGSGKSSLVFHTLHAEAERRWLSTLPAWRRLMAEALPRPPLRSSRGLVPTLALRQESSEPGAATSNLAGLAGLREPLVALWAAASTPISPDTRQPMLSHSPAEAARSLVERHAGLPVRILFRPSDARPRTWIRRGFVRGAAGGTAVELEALPPDTEVGGLSITVDRLVASPSALSRMAEAVQTAYRLGDELCVVEIGSPEAAPEILRFSGVPRCAATGRFAPVPSPGLFSPRSPRGACPGCAGSGGDDGNCRVCGGTGLREEAGWFEIGSRNLSDFLSLEADRAADAVGDPVWEGIRSGPCRELVEEIRSRLAALSDLGLGYLPLGRSAGTLSQGEERRARLATLVGAPFSGVAYVLDEPTTGLHPGDLPPVHRLLSRLREGGATLVVVEHDLRSLEWADRVVETGPGPGELGGRILYAGPPAGLADADTPSGRWLRGLDRPPARKPRTPTGRAVLSGIRGRNLSIPRLEIPLGVFCAVTGVSGAGKSSLLLDAVVPALRSGGRWSGGGIAVDAAASETPFDEIRPVEVGGEWIRSPRSLVATVSGMLDELRPLFSSLPEAKARGWSATRFSPNAKGGRCERCEGLGEERVRLHLLPDAWIDCANCGGSRFEASTLEVLWKGLSIADVLALPLDRAAELFRNHPRLGPLCSKMVRAGLSHLSGGRRTNSLSGGEALRLRLASAVALPGRKRILWALDEPSSGLHPRDVLSLLSVLEDLVEAGHSVLAITHDPLLASRADHVLELGPGPGREGGRLLFSGSPQELAALSLPSSEAVGRELA
jgi:excinuclease ABC subunit A